MKNLILTVLALVITSQVFAQQHKTENVIIVTLDGLRWQELYRGADSALINSKYTDDKKDVRKNYWAASTDQRRALLFPFFWSTIANKASFMVTAIWAVKMRWPIRITFLILAITKYLPVSRMFG